ncbi:MAG: Gfo/Idh/MocA family oxidoreductase [Armatimonadetes bacterium]|nr:Gfo/Idh/MocA family oxidoreductase [Armatimonadota bacterium]MDW8121763.1 Gfo/Idh/MocA family oxidoreductase [Armatimonadota bacterium]
MDRRQFLRRIATAAGLLILKDSRSAWTYQANEKLNLAFVGAGGRGADLVKEFANLGENVVALCDVDDRMAQGTFQQFPKAKRFKDFRKMLEEMTDQIDAVVVATPDHTHAVASVMAMRMGKGVYCEKPLTWCVDEARLMREVAMEKKVATQMGNQGAGADWSRTLIEILWSGVLGEIKEVHIWTDRPIWPQGIDRPSETVPVPPELDWDLWLGPAPERPYHPAYLPFRWRGWWDFGTGALGDIGCHAAYIPFVAFHWGRLIQEGIPFEVDSETSGHNRDSFPVWSIVRYHFPSVSGQPPVKFVWYDGGKKPPQDLLMGEQAGDNGTVIVGSKGSFVLGKLLPAERFKDYQPPAPTLPRVSSHYKEWTDACKGQGPAPMSNFVDYASYLTEIVLVGNLSIWAGEKIVWDPKKMEVPGHPELTPLIKREYRKGWEL